MIMVPSYRNGNDEGQIREGTVRIDQDAELKHREVQQAAGGKRQGRQDISAMPDGGGESCREFLYLRHSIRSYAEVRKRGFARLRATHLILACVAREAIPNARKQDPAGRRRAPPARLAGGWPRARRDGDGVSADEASGTAMESPGCVCGHSRRWIRDFPD
jgi:hypothetical protein